MSATDKASSDPIVKGQGRKAKKARYRIRKFEELPEAEREKFPLLRARYERSRAYLVTLALLQD